MAKVPYFSVFKFYTNHTCMAGEPGWVQNLLFREIKVLMNFTLLRIMDAVTTAMVWRNFALR